MSQTVSFLRLIEDGVLAIGDGYRAKNNELGIGGPIFLRAGHVTDSHIDFADAECFKSNHSTAIRTKMARSGDTVITTKGNSTGRTTFVDASMPEFVYSPHLSFWRSLDDERLDPRYLRYWSLSSEFREQLAGMSASTDMAPYLSLGDQKRLRISLPTIGQQRRIGAILGGLDDKIERNRKISETLEAMARALFKSWFVDFDPVRVKARCGDLVAELGLSPEIAAVFPDRLVELKGGAEIPSGWRLGVASEIIEINPRRALSGGAKSPYVDMKALPNAGASIDGFTYREPSSGSRFRNGDTIVARITPCLENGKTAFLDCLPPGESAWGSTEFIVLCSRGAVPKPLCYLLARDETFRDYLITHMTGSSGRQRVPTDVVGRFPFTIGPDRVYELFGRLVDPLFKAISLTTAETSVLRACRDELLPRLLSGELTVACGAGP